MSHRSRAQTRSHAHANAAGVRAMTPRIDSMPLARRLLPVLAALFVTGCAITEPIARPQIELPTAWAESATSSTDTSADAIHAAWWQSFGSAQLDALVAEAMSTAPDLRIQAERVAQAELALRQAGASLFPALNLSGGSGTRNVDGNESGSTDLSLGASYELDL